MCFICRRSPEYPYYVDESRLRVPVEFNPRVLFTLKVRGADTLTLAIQLYTSITVAIIAHLIIIFHRHSKNIAETISPD